MTARKIARVLGLGLMAMPIHYDPSQIARDDATHDNAICGAAEELATLRRASKQVSDMARETAAPGTSEDALSELDAIDEAWRDAIEAARRGVDDEVAPHLERAALYAARWGSSLHEDKALAMLRGVG